MELENTLEINGMIQRNPLAEVLAEIIHAKLDGSIRVSGPERKTIAYFDCGKMVYAVSNSKKFRLFNVLLTKNRIDKAILAKIPDFIDDIRLSAALVQAKKLTESEITEAVNLQIEEIMTDTLSWTDGSWAFNPLARIRDGLKFEPNIERLLTQYARCLSAEMIANRFKSVEEIFAVAAPPKPSVETQPHEEFVLSKFGTEPMSLGEILNACRLPESAALQSLYPLWIAGFLTRSNWNAAISERKIAAISGTKIEKVKSAVILETHKVQRAEEPAEVPTPETVHETITTDTYLGRVENAETHYDILGVDPKVDTAALKQSYFRLAKQFHPDHFYKEGGDVLARVQRAFTQLAHAYETLKTPESRETYDFKIRKELEAKEKRRAAGLAHTPDADEMQNEYGVESFQAGMDLLLDDEYEAAVPHFARAVHFNPEIARYHAYFGKALADDPRQRHKAESEMQTAVRLEPKSAEFRLMLVEFFLDHNLMKRAEGEINRLLAVDPNNREAKRILADIQTNTA